MGNDVRAVFTVTRQPFLRDAMHNIAAAQRRYDRRRPVEAPSPAAPDPMDQLRDDLADRRAAQDIVSAVWDRLNDNDADIDMVRQAANGDQAGAIALFEAAIKAVALRRIACAIANKNRFQHEQG